MTPAEHALIAIRALLDDDVGSPRHEVELDAIGFDSLARVVLAYDLEGALDVTVPDGVESTWETVGDVVAWCEQATAGRTP